MPEVMYVHKICDDGLVILEEDHYAIKTLVTYDAEDISEATYKMLRFPYEEDAAEVIRIVNSQFEPLAIRFESEEELDPDA